MRHTLVYSGWIVSEVCMKTFPDSLRMAAENLAHARAYYEAIGATNSNQPTPEKKIELDVAFALAHIDFLAAIRAYDLERDKYIESCRA